MKPSEFKSFRRQILGIDPRTKVQKSIKEYNRKNMKQEEIDTTCLGCGIELNNDEIEFCPECAKWEKSDEDNYEDKMEEEFADELFDDGLEMDCE